MTDTSPIESGLAEPAKMKPIVCARCGSDNVRESATRRAADLIPLALSKVAYRCRACRGRFYLKRSKEQDTSPARRKRPERSREPFWLRPNVRRRTNDFVIAGCALLAFGLFLLLLVRMGSADF